MCPCGFEDQVEFLSKGPGTEEEDHDKGVGKANFGAVDGTIAHGLEEGEILCIVRIENETIDTAL